MGRHAQLIIGPAGSGKSTYCNTIRTHCENLKRSVHCINLDPAAEIFNYPVTIDIRELISVEDVMDELSYGPNGGLVYAMEFLIQNIDWFEEQLGDYEDDYLLIDCPGQIELYSHISVMKDFVESLQKMGYQICVVYLLDSQYIIEPSKFIAGTLMCLSAMVKLELPHVNVMTKMDLVQEKTKENLNPTTPSTGLTVATLEKMDRFLNPDVHGLVDELNQETHPRFHKLNQALGTLIEDYNMVSFIPLDPTDEESISVLLQHVDNAIQFGEDADVQISRDVDEEDDE